MRTLFLTLIVALVVTGCVTQPSMVVSADSDAPLVVILVRHAERLDASSDSVLSVEGHARAEDLARVLRSVDLDVIHSSDYARTRSTAAPVARDSRCEVALYDARDLASLALELRASTGRHLVVGHSNTTPEMVRLLGGDAGEPIDDATEFDRMYVLTFDASGAVDTRVMRYGQ